MRYDGNQTTLVDVQSAVGEFFIAIDARIYRDFAYVGARNQNKGSNFSLPAAVPPVAPTPTGVAITEIRAPISFTFVGRSLGGRRCSLEIYAWDTVVPERYLYVRGETSEVDAGLNYLQGPTPPTKPPGTFLGIDGTEVIWYDRVTVNYNDYWVRQARR